MATQTMPRPDLDLEPAAADRDSPPHSATASDTAVRRDERALPDEASGLPPQAWHVLAEVDRRGGVRFRASPLEIPPDAQPATRTHSAPNEEEHMTDEHTRIEEAPELGADGADSRRPLASRYEGTDAHATTSPAPEADNQATVPPGNGDLDEDAVARGRETLQQAGGGH